MSEDLDPQLRRLFAETAEHPADEAFVQSVAARTQRERHLGPAVRRLAAASLPALALGAVAAGLGLAAQQSFTVVAPLLTASPTGMAASLALVAAGVVCFRLLAPLVTRRF
jgi:hypothetical protein